MVLFKFYNMRSSRPSSPPYLFMFTSFIFIFISIQTSSCVGYEQYVNCNRPFICAISQTLHPILRLTVLPPQLVVPSRQLAESPQGISGASIRIINSCDYTIWPGIRTNSVNATLDSTGFELAPGGTRTFQAPPSWTGSFWGRTGCTFDQNTGQGSCVTADCGSNQVECNGAGAKPPVTLAEFSIPPGSNAGVYFYDLSLVNGYNLPMVVDASGGSGACTSTGCVIDLNRQCPNELRVGDGAACKSACEAFGSPEYCCTGTYSTPDTCKPSNYSKMFKAACPRAYSYAYDDATSTFTCKGADYTITFCPSSASQKSAGVSPQSPSPTQYISPAPQLIVPSGVPEPPSKSNWWLKFRIGIISAAVAGIVVISLVIIYKVKRRHFSSNTLKVGWKRGEKNYQINDEEFIKKYGSIAPKRYTYSDVKKLTNSFKEKVGQGGYGVVYKGKLPDGRMVAVKILSTSKGNGEDFINEVASISRTSHINIVTLLGFCYEKTKRALIYEFMPNESLDKFIYDKGSPITNCHLDNKTMFQIAVGIARGLEYLHQGCNTRILHFDIKPHNILLDEDLRPKISDFGLAKLCKTKESIVSMTGMRGTAGYIAPEVFSRNFGGVSHKSDVYSYGMLVLEMVGGRKNFDGGLSHTSETYFPHWIYTKLEQKKNCTTFEEITGEAEEETTKKMIIVSLWCIQTNPLDRPSMGKVIEMLEGTLQSLPFPPKPFLDSPTRSPQDSTMTS